MQVPENETIFAFPPPDNKAVTSSQPVAVVLCEEPPIELDMGEASREEGFRLYGCR